MLVSSKFLECALTFCAGGLSGEWFAMSNGLFLVMDSSNNFSSSRPNSSKRQRDFSEWEEAADGVFLSLCSGC